MARQYYYQRDVCWSWRKVVSDVSVADSRSHRVLRVRNLGFLQQGLLSGFSKLSRTFRSGCRRSAASTRRRRNGDCWRPQIRFRSSVRCQCCDSRTDYSFATNRCSGLFARPIQRSAIRCGGKCNGSHVFVTTRGNAVFHAAR